MAFTLCSCGNPAGPVIDASQDLDHVRKNGLRVGVTEHGILGTGTGTERVGMDATLTKGFGEYIGAEVIFVDVDWDKFMDLLDSGEIDCVWNTMTRTPEREARIDTTIDYLYNAQVVILKKEDAPSYPTLESCSHLLFAVEGGSTGRISLEDLHYRVTPYESQKDAMDAVLEGKADAALVDKVSSLGLIKNDKTYADLTIACSLDDETLCVGFRKGSPLTAEANKYLQQIIEDGTLMEVLQSYGLEDAFPSD